MKVQLLILFCFFSLFAKAQQPLDTADYAHIVKNVVTKHYITSLNQIGSFDTVIIKSSSSPISGTYFSDWGGTAAHHFVVINEGGPVIIKGGIDNYNIHYVDWYGFGTSDPYGFIFNAQSAGFAIPLKGKCHDIGFYGVLVNGGTQEGFTAKIEVDDWVSFKFDTSVARFNQNHLHYENVKVRYNGGEAWYINSSGWFHRDQVSTRNYGKGAPFGTTGTFESADVADNITNAATTTNYIYADPLFVDQWVSIQSVITRVSGAVAGTVTLQGSNDNSSYTTITSQALINNASQAYTFTYATHAWNYFKVVIVTTGTVSAKLNSYLDFFFNPPYSDYITLKNIISIAPGRSAINFNNLRHSSIIGGKFWHLGRELNTAQGRAVACTYWVDPVVTDCKVFGSYVNNFWMHGEGIVDFERNYGDSSGFYSTVANSQQNAAVEFAVTGSRQNVPTTWIIKDNEFYHGSGGGGSTQYVLYPGPAMTTNNIVCNNIGNVTIDKGPNNYPFVYSNNCGVVNKPPVVDAGLNANITSPVSTYTFATAAASDPEGGALTYKWTLVANSFKPPDHTVFIWFENHDYTDIVGNSNAPYINSLIGQGTLFTNAHGNFHPSKPNYYAMFSGSNQGITTDACTTGKPFSTPNLFTVLKAVNKRFAWYSEGLPNTGDSTCSSGDYAQKHNPTTGFSNVPDSVNKKFSDLGTNYDNWERVLCITPDLQHDMHNGTIAQGDTWVNTNMSGYITWAKTHNSALVIYFDENDGTSGNRIPVVIVGQHIKQNNTVGNLYDHYNWTKTLSSWNSGDTSFNSNVASAKVIGGFYYNDSTYCINNDAVLNPTVCNLSPGTYTFRLTATDNLGASSYDDVTIVVNPAVNQPPIVNAGANATITLPVSSYTFTATASDPDGTIAAYAWTKVSGGTYSITNAALLNPTVSALSAGIYIFRLTVTDNNGAAAYNDITITVNNAANKPPSANAGADAILTLPANTYQLAGSATDIDGTIVSTVWTKTSGPGYVISNANILNPLLSSLVQGTYVFTLTVTDNGGATNSDDITITVNHALNTPPIADAGNDISIISPVSSCQLNGSISDADGTVTALWTEISGGSYTIDNASAVNPNISGLSVGIYVFRLTATDDSSATNYDDVSVVVYPPVNKAPVVNAGNDTTITLPATTINLNGIATDESGISSTLWTVDSTTACTITSATSVITTANCSVAGEYVFTLSATDDSSVTSYDDFKAAVNNAIVVIPVAISSADRTVQLPKDTVVLNQSGTDTIVQYTSKIISTHFSPAIYNVHSQQPYLSALTEGDTILIQLRVKNNYGYFAKDTTTIIVLADTVNHAPVPKIWQDTVQRIRMPIDSVVFDASQSYDPDKGDYVVSWSWEQIAGDTLIIKQGLNASYLLLSGLIPGEYKFRLTVTDTHGLSAYVIVTVDVSVSVKIKVTAPKVRKVSFAPVYGALWSGFTVAEKMQAANLFNFKEQRLLVNFLTWNGTNSPITDQLIDSGQTVTLNIQPVFPADTMHFSNIDMVAFASDVNTLTDNLNPDKVLLVAGNEGDADAYSDVTDTTQLDYYIKMQSILSRIAHAKGFQTADGGITSEGVVYATYRWLSATGNPDTISFLHYCIPVNRWVALVNRNNAAVEFKIAKAKYILERLDTIPYLTYANPHLYFPFARRMSDTATNYNSGFNGIYDIVAMYNYYMPNRKIMTNEFGFVITNASVIANVVDDLRRNKFYHQIYWNSPDSPDVNAIVDASIIKTAAGVLYKNNVQ